MQKSEKNKIVICADLNLRASIAVMRSLKSERLDLIIGVSGYISALLTIPSLLGNIQLCKRIWIYNSKEESEFIQSLIFLGSKSNTHIVFFPMGEKLLRWAIRHKELLKINNIVIPSHEITDYEIISDKFSFIEMCRKFELDVPEEYLKFSDIYLYPYVVKPKKATWGVSNVLEVPMLVETKAAHLKIISKALNHKDHIIQKYIDGPSFYYCALYKNGEIHLRFIQQTIVQQPGGKSVICAVPSELPNEINNKIDRLFRSLQWSGALMVELKYNQGKYYIIECNPRLWGPLQCAIDNGANFPLMLYNLMTGKNIHPELSNNSKANGFIWLWGFIDGLFYMFSTRNKYQLHKSSLEGVKFRDVWFRSDSLIYFIFEPIYSLAQWINSIFKRLFRII